MIDGIYESIINKELKKELDSSEYFFDTKKMKPESAKNLLTSYLKEITQKALDTIIENDNDISNSEHLLKEIRICNEILDLLRERLSFDEYKELEISEDAEILEYAFQKWNHSSFDGKNIVKPISSLVEPSLFTNSPNKLSLLPELQKEILSCDEVYFLVSFIKMSGLNPLMDALKEFDKQGKKIKIITTTYMQATQYNAILKLAELENAEVKISYNTDKNRLHAKAYIFKRNNGYSTFYIGSSNLSSVAISSGSEWNVKLTEKTSPDIYKSVLAQFEQYWNSGEYESFKMDDKSKEKLVKALDKSKDSSNNKVTFDIKPYDYQEEILEKLEVERDIYGRYKNLIVAATGVGKTVVAAFDYRKFRSEHPNCKMLYIAHRKEILEKSLETFRFICKDMNMGELYVGKYKPHSVDTLFVSVQGANKLMKHVAPDYYDYIIIDEFHHAAARTYDKLLNYFEPKILLGLTATPERRDGQDVTKYFDYNIAAEMRLPEAINKKLLVPFQYYGLTDTVDLSSVKWHAYGYDTEDLNKLFVDDKASANRRNNMIINSLLEHVDDIDDVKGLGFCASVKHAEFMAETFNENDIPSIALSGNSSDEERETAIQRITNGEIKFIFTRDLYNEGVDIPCINTELLLRPTDSLTIFLQQLGRGLRLDDGKECLTVLDFIGESNRHFKYSDKLAAMIGNNIESVESSITKGFPVVPVGCSITLEKVAAEHVLKNIKQNKNSRKELVDRIKNFTEQTGQELTLKNFLNYYNMDISEIYKNKVTFYRLKKEAGLIDYEETENDVSIINRLNNLFFIDSPQLIRGFYKLLDCKNRDSLSSSYQHRPKLAEAIGSKLLLNEMYYTLYIKKPSLHGFDSIEDAMMDVVNSDVMNIEIREILDYVSSRIDVLPVENDVGHNVPLEVYSTYSRNQICAAFGIYDEEHYGTVREGVKYIPELDHDILFVTLNKDDKGFTETTSYDDYVVNQNTFHWQTQSKVSDSSDTLRRYVESDGRVSLFVRKYKNENGKAAPYIYLGECDYISHRGSKPVSILWHMKHRMPAKFLEEVDSMD